VNKPTVDQVLPLVQTYCKLHPAGGSLHIVLDDGNVETVHIQYCRDQVAGCVPIATMSNGYVSGSTTMTTGQMRVRWM
jgi:hypothetical protein